MLATAQGNKGMLPHPLSHRLRLPERSSSADCPKRGVRMVLPSEVGLKAATNSSVFSKRHEHWINQYPLFNHPSCRPLLRAVRPARASVPLCPPLQWEETPTGAKKLVASQFCDLAEERLSHIFTSFLSLCSISFFFQFLSLHLF